MAEESDKKKCSFCGKSSDEVENMLAGGDLYICNECVMLCYEILTDKDFEIEHTEGLISEK